jgi:predicted P-loop ATPase
VTALSDEELERIRADQQRVNREHFARLRGEYPGSEQQRRDDELVRRAKEAPPVSWTGMLRRRGDRPIGDEANVLQALRSAPELAGLARFNEFAGRTELAKAPPWRDAAPGEPWTDADDVDLQAWLQVRGLEVRARATIADCVSRAALDHPHHPVREYLTGLTWDGRSRLTHWLLDYLGADAPADYLEAIGPAFLISAIARVMRPGCQVDHTLVLEMRQGGGKTSAVRILGHPWITEGLPDLASKDAAIHVAGVWIVEISELAAMRRADIEAVKGFLTRTHDRYRPPYARRTVEQPRQCVFIGTTNEAAYLRDRTGNRRFWPVRCTDIDLAALERDRDQLFAEAMQRYQAGEAWHLAGDLAALAASEQEAREIVSELEQDVCEYLAQIAAEGTTEIAVRDVLRYAFNVNSTDDPKGAAGIGPQVAAAMVRCGWQRVGRTGWQANRRTVYRLVKQ